MRIGNSEKDTADSCFYFCNDAFCRSWWLPTALYSTSQALLSRYFGDEDEMDDKDKFLRDYLLNRRWLDTNQPGPRAPMSLAASRRFPSFTEKQFWSLCLF